jgi:hypothetical protein
MASWRGKTWTNFPSAIGEEIFNIRIMTNWGVLRIAVLGSDVATNPNDDSN